MEHTTTNILNFSRPLTNIYFKPIIVIYNEFFKGLLLLSKPPTGVFHLTVINYHNYTKGYFPFDH